MQACFIERGKKMKVDENNYIRELRNRNEKALDYIIDNYGWIIKSIVKNLNYEDIDDLNISEDSFETKALENELSDEVESLLKCLKEKDRDLFYKLYVEEMDIDEVSEEYGMKKDVVYNRLSRAKKKIKNIFNINKRRGVK